MFLVDFFELAIRCNGK